MPINYKRIKAKAEVAGQKVLKESETSLHNPKKAV